MSSERVRRSRHHVIVCFLGAALGGAALLPALAQDRAKDASPPDFMGNGTGWNSAGGLEPVAGSPEPVEQDPKVKYVGNNRGEQPTWRYADVNNPNLTDFAKAGLKKANHLVEGGGRKLGVWIQEQNEPR